MRVLGISFGRKMKNCELMVKEALMEAEKAGAEVAFIRMLDLTIKPCIGCGGCGRSLANGGNGRCVLKDDLPFVDEEIMKSDAIIVAAPVYVLGPTGQYKQMADRFGPSHDLAFLTETNKQRMAEGKTGEELIDPRNFRQRYAGLISVGGARTKNWVSFGLPTMDLLCMSSGIKVVDKLDANDMGDRGIVVLDEKMMERARKLGRHVVSAIGKDPKDVKWAGDEEGTCPVCHNNLITMNGTTTVECPVCGISGQLSVEGDKVKVTFSESEQLRSRMNYDGKLEHFREIRSFGAVAGPKMEAAKDRLPAMLKKYEGYGEIGRK